MCVVKVLAAARFPLAGEAIAPVAEELRKLGHDVVVIGVHNDTPATKRHGGSAAVFERQNLPFVQLGDWGYMGDIISVPDSIAQTLITSLSEAPRNRRRML